MTARKPPGMTWETWIDRQIREGMENGSFDNLPGHGRPLPDLDGTHDELWWIRNKLRREQISYLPPTLAIRKELEAALEAAAAAGTEAEVRELVARINARIRHVNATATSGPPSTVAPVDVERIVARWRAARNEAAPGAGGDLVP
jgi:DnaJ homologue, subfamily C, member 28, conserved domain